MTPNFIYALIFLQFSSTYIYFILFIFTSIICCYVFLFHKVLFIKELSYKPFCYWSKTTYAIKKFILFFRYVLSILFWSWKKELFTTVKVYNIVYIYMLHIFQSNIKIIKLFLIYIRQLLLVKINIIMFYDLCII